MKEWHLYIPYYNPTMYQTCFPLCNYSPTVHFFQTSNHSSISRKQSAKDHSTTFPLCAPFFFAIMGASSCLSSSAVALFTGDRHRQKNRNSSLLPSTRRGIRVICCASNDSVKSSRSCTELVAERLPMPMLAEDDTIFASNGMMSFVPYKETNGTNVDSTRGIGIAGFLEGKQLLVTGATGFLAKGDSFFIMHPVDS